MIHDAFETEYILVFGAGQMFPEKYPLFGIISVNFFVLVLDGSREFFTEGFEAYFYQYVYSFYVLLNSISGFIAVSKLHRISFIKRSFRSKTLRIHVTLLVRHGVYGASGNPAYDSIASPQVQKWLLTPAEAGTDLSTLMIERFSCPLWLEMFNL